MKPYKDISYANNRLCGCIIRTMDGDPVQVISYADNESFLCKRLLNKQLITVHNNDLNLDPVSLGWVNSSSGNITYLARMPMREDWRQGLRSNNVKVMYGGPFSEVRLKDLYRTIRNEYPSFKYACNRAIKGEKSTAFSNKWAILYDGSLVFRGKKVGKIEGTFPILSTEYHYLDKILKEGLNEQSDFTC